MMQLLEQSLYAISNAILIPTLIAVLGLLIWIILLAGGLLREWLGRSEVNRVIQKLRKRSQECSATTADLLLEIQKCPGGIPSRLGRKLKVTSNQTDCAKALEDVEIDVAGCLSQLAWITRIAPMLGLMGTLIPLGPALTSLASGDIAKLSSNLVVAFTTTVVGVFLGCASFSMSLLRKHWYNRDLSDLEFVFLRKTETTLEVYAPEKA